MPTFVNEFFTWPYRFTVLVFFCADTPVAKSIVTIKVNKILFLIIMVSFGFKHVQRNALFLLKIRNTPSFVTIRKTFSGVEACKYT
jgi:hypothetical protein